MNIAPVFCFQQIGNEGKNHQEQNHPDTNVFALQLGGFTRVIKKCRDVASRFRKLFR